MSRALFLGAAFAATAPFVVYAETEIAFEDVPENVLDTALRTAPGVTFDRVSIDRENGRAIYEFEAADHNGKHIEVDVYEDGRLEEIEMEVTLDETPLAVRQTLENEADGFEPDYIELSVRSGRYPYVYEFDGVLSGRQLSVEIAETGELLSISHDLSS